MGDRTEIEWTALRDAEGLVLAKGATWNPVRGCTKVSEGCRNCYAMSVAARFSGPGQPYEGLATRAPARWTGTVQFVEERLRDPLSWQRPKLVFVNSMSDLFHEDIPDEWIDRVFAVMALAKRHTFQILSKRPSRMRDYMNDPMRQHRIAQAIDAIQVDQEHDAVEHWSRLPDYDGYEASSHGRIRSQGGILSTCFNPDSGREQITLWNRGLPRTVFVHTLVLSAHRPMKEPGMEACHRNGNKMDNRLANLRWGTRSENQQDKVRHGSNGGPQKLTMEEAQTIRSLRRTKAETQQSLADRYGVSRSLISLIESGGIWAPPLPEWPLPNVWLGTSVENQETADERIGHLIATPAAVRFLSCEPLLGPLSFRWAAWAPLNGKRVNRNHLDGVVGHIQWVIAGGESGPKARPCDEAWLRELRDQCVEAGIPYFLKQKGGWPDKRGHDKAVLDGERWTQMPSRTVSV